MCEIDVPQTSTRFCLNPSVNHRDEWQDKPDDAIFTEIRIVIHTARRAF